MARVTVTAFTAARMLEIERASIVNGIVQDDYLVLTTRGGDDIIAGNVRGPKGEKGNPGGVPDATNSEKGGVRLQGNLAGSAATPTVTGALNGTVDVSLAKVTDPAKSITKTIREFLQSTITRSGKAQTIWAGTGEEFSVLDPALVASPGFIAVITE